MKPVGYGFILLAGSHYGNARRGYSLTIAS
jgi:hypothetical protein